MMEGMKQSGDIFLRNADLALLFGRAGQELTNTILMGGKAFELYVEKQKELGLILDGKTISATEAFNDRLSRIGFTFRVIRDAITTSFLPVLDQFAESIENTLATKNAKKLGQDFAVGIIDALINILKASDDFRMTFEENFLSINKVISGLGIGLNSIGVAFNLFNIRFSTSIQQATKFKNEITRLIGENENLLKTFEKPIVPSENIAKGIKGLNDIKSAIKSAFGDGEDEGGNFFEVFGKKTEMFNEQMAKMVADIQTPLSTFGESFKTTGTMIGDTIVSSMKKFEDTIVDGLMKGKLSFKDFADFVIKELLRIAIRKFIIENMFNAITGGFGSLFGKKGMAGFVGDINTAGMPVAEGGGFTGFGSRTGGVDGRGGFPAILHPNETVIDHRRGGRGGMPINITYNIQAFDSRDTIQAITENAPTISAIIESEFNKRGRRGFVT